uniref:Uncharacterized protein n=1 Tax=Klebsiella pneumoniae TaxID=573 RepID=A0A7S5L2W7_KLEPN|nr:hypothetical protein pKpnB199_00289 [Klebsiella pneumoniae]QVQ58279.1 hypothetical protein [Klebsiella pneumoniae]UMW89782.1 hypothetical protein [Klebsiella pneumoniae]URZ92363.1 hypothetical protein [Klebsiella pneumoniae]URZ92935.1 hypothetical protein [Klebsiella pneumoniae]
MPSVICSYSCALMDSVSLKIIPKTKYSYLSQSEKKLTFALNL